MDQELRSAYWRENLRLIFVLLSFWGFISFGCSILFVDWLDQFRFMGFKLGFWIAQQGSIYGFVAIILVYIFQMKRIEKKYKMDV